MAFGAGTSLGNGGNAGANQSSIVATLTAQANAGSFVVIAFALDNFATSAGDEGAIPSVTDSAGGNTWAKAVEFCNPSASPAAQAGATISIWYSTLVNAIPNGGTISTGTLSNATSRDASAWAARAFTKGANTKIFVEKTATLANNAADPGSLNATTLNRECLRIRAIASETNSTTALTVTTNWTEQTGNRSGSGSAAANITARMEFRISTGTGDASDPTYTSADHASAYVAFREDPMPAGAQGAFALAGQQATLRKASKTVGAFGSYTLAGQAVELRVVTYGPTASEQLGVAAWAVGQGAVAGGDLPAQSAVAVMAADTGAFALIGQDASLRGPGAVAPDHLGVADAAVGSYAVAGQDLPAQTAGAYTITAAFGTYALVGTQAVLDIHLVANFGGFALVGQQVGLFKGVPPRILTASFGGFALNGQAFNVRRIYTMPAGTGTFALAGQKATLRPSAGRGNYQLIGQAAVLRRGYTLTAGFGGFALNGQAVELRRSHPPLVATFGAYVLTGQSAGLLRTHLPLTATFGTYALQGRAVGLAGPGPKVLAAGTGFFALSGRDAILVPTIGTAADQLGVATVAVAAFPVGGSNLAAPVVTATLTAGHGVYALVGTDSTSHYSFAASAGIFALTGQQAGLLTPNKRLVVDTGSYALVGQVVGLFAVPPIEQLGVATLPVAAYPVGGSNLPDQLNTPILSAGSGTYSLSGIASTLHREMAASFGGYALAGQAAGLSKSGGAKTIAASFGGYAVVGQQVGFRRTYVMPAAFGAYALQGQQVSWRRTYKVVATFGTYALAGQQVVLRRTRIMPAAFGGYALAGQAAVLRRARVPLTATFGGYTLNGQPVGLIGAQKQITISRGTYALAGQAVTLRLTHKLVATFGAFALSGPATGLKVSLPVTFGTFALQGQQVALRAGHRLIAGTGGYALAGQLAALRKAKRLSGAVGSYAVVGRPAGLKHGYMLIVQRGIYATAGQQAGPKRGYFLGATRGNYQLIGFAATLSTFGHIVLGGSLGTYSLVGQPVFLRVQRQSLAVGYGNGHLIGQNIGLRRGYTLTAEIGFYHLLGPDLTLYPGSPRRPTVARSGGATTSTGVRHGSQADYITRR